MIEESYTVTRASYAKETYAVRCPSPDGWKTRAARLIGDGLKCRYSGREHAYMASASKVIKFCRLFDAGWDASSFTGELKAPFVES